MYFHVQCSVWQTVEYGYHDGMDEGMGLWGWRGWRGLGFRAAPVGKPPSSNQKFREPSAAPRPWELQYPIGCVLHPLLHPLFHNGETWWNYYTSYNMIALTEYWYQLTGTGWSHLLLLQQKKYDINPNNPSEVCTSVIVTFEVNHWNASLHATQSWVSIKSSPELKIIYNKRPRGTTP